MKFKLFKKFFLINALIILLSLTIITVILSIFVNNYITDEKTAQLTENCKVVAEVVANGDDIYFDHSNNFAHFRALSSVTKADIFITDTKGKVILCGCDEWSIDGFCPHNEANISAAVMQKVLNGKYDESGTLDGHFSDIQFTCGTVLKNPQGKTVGAVFSTVSPEDVRLFFNAILRLFLFSAIIPIIIMFFLEYYISYRFSKPLQLMSQAAQSIAKGDFSRRIPVRGDDEIGQLAVSFNKMTNSLVQIEGTRRKFIANISHELKTPMTTISGFIDGIIDGTIPPDKQGYYLEIVSSEVKRLSRLVQSMLSLAKLESGEQQINTSNFDLSDMLLKIVVSQEQRIGEKELDIEGLDTIGKVFVSADYDLIYQVVYNLVDNAIKFTNDGGSIKFKVFDNNESVNFVVENTGEGIEQKDIPFVFDRFYKTDKSRSAIKDSTGLGLYLANTIITIHGGTIGVKSEVNNYTEFSFSLPNVNEPKTGHKGKLKR